MNSPRTIESDSSVCPALAAPILVRGIVAAKLMIDLTLYLSDPTIGELDILFDAYDRLCPTGRSVRYRTTELEYWPYLDDPQLTASGRAAALAGIGRPYLEPVRHRIFEGRAFDAQVWDGRPLSDESGSWSFSVRASKTIQRGRHAFARVLMPINADVAPLVEFAHQMMSKVEISSGHGGFVFAYDPWLKEQVFDLIYALARRFWNVDVEDLNATLPLMGTAIKGVSWLTIVGRSLLSRVGLSPEALAAEFGSEMNVVVASSGVLCRLEEFPEAQDVHRRQPVLSNYHGLARRLAALIPNQHPAFPGACFSEPQRTVDWLRRYVDPGRW